MAAELAPLGRNVLQVTPKPADVSSRIEVSKISTLRLKLVDHLHTFAEWQDPHGSSIPIHSRDILKAGGEDEQEIRAVIRELQAAATAEESFSS